jgi:hypothetical protein
MNQNIRPGLRRLSFGGPPEELTLPGERKFYQLIDIIQHADEIMLNQPVNSSGVPSQVGPGPVDTIRLARP